MDEKEKNVNDPTNTVETSDQDRNENGEKEVRKRAPAHRWHQFCILTPTSAILRGSYAMTHLRFKPRSRGNQGTPCSVVAIVYSRLTDPKNWTKTTVDEILQHGDKLFTISATRNRVGPGVYMTVSLVFSEFYVDDNKCTICAKEGIVFGNLFTESIGCPDFSDGLQRFFKVNDAGVVTAQGLSVAMWRHPNSGFFCFDPSPRGEDGTKCPSGVACVLRFKCMNDMRDHFLGNMDKRYDSRYCVASVTVLKLSPVRRGPFDATRRKIMASKNGGTSSCSVPRKKTLNCLRSLDFEKENSSCARKGKTKMDSKGMELKKEPLSITISNYSIDARFASQPLLVDQNHFETGYDYYDMHVNVPSTFKELSGNMAILHGWTHEGSEMYKGKGNQNVANCVMAIGMRKVHGVKSWLRPKLDEILALGDKMYADVRAEKPGIKSMTANDLNDTKVKIEERKLVVDVDLMTIVGTLNSKVSSVLNLKQALEEFFLVNTDGVLECTSMAVAVWTQDDCYYTFDPRQCGPLGIRIVEEKGKGRRGKVGKTGKGDGGEKKLKGKCCVIRFPDIDSLVGLFVKNVDQAKRNDRFTLRHVSVVDDVPGTRSWNEFGPGEPGKWVLRGSIANDDDEFEDESRGLQGPAIPVVGIVKANETGPNKWTGGTIDEAIRDGDAYYNWSRKFWSTEDEDRKIVVTDLRRDFYMKNRKAKVDLQDSSVVGNLKATTSGEELDLSRGIAQFFDKHQYGVVQIGDLWVAIWKQEEELKDKSKETTYYYFDSNPRGKLGKQTLEDDDEEAVACVLRTPELAQLTKFIEENVDPENENHEFAIHAVRVMGVGEPMSDEELQLDMKTPIKPELNHYTAVGDEAACLSGNFNQGDERIFKHQTRNKQQAATSLVTLAMTKIYSPFLWYPEVLDEILKIGDKVTADNLENLPEFGADEENPREYLRANEIDEDFNIGVNRISFELEEESASGAIAELAEALEGYFETNTHGVFSCDSVIIPLWKHGSVYFMMDPKGRDNVGVPAENEGTAVVMWFLSPAGLANSLQASIATTDATFTVDNVIVENTYETRVAEAERAQRARSAEELWYHFPKMSEGVWGFSGEVGLADERFPEENRANQTAAVAVMAVVFSKVYEPRYWKPEVLNEVIVTGDRLHSKCVERLGRKDPRVNEIVTEFFLSNRRIDLSIKDCVQAGDLAGRPPKIQDLQTGIDKFFEKNVSGALSSCGTNIGLWKFNGFYYALVPNFSADGEPESDGPRVLRFADTRLLVENLVSNLKEGDYEITGIEVVDWNKLPPWKYDPSPAVRPSNLPTLNAYRRLPNARAILRGTIHQASEIFPQLVRNKQTAANCVVALGLSVVKSPITWTAKSLDEILVIGKNVHSETLKARPSRTKIKPKDVIRVFYVGVNVLTADVEEGTVSGLVAIEPPKPEVKGKKGRKVRVKKATSRGKKGKKGKLKRERPPPPPPIFLEQGIAQFFEKNRAGILVAGRYMVAIWKDLGVYFVYDPRSSDEVGSRTDFGTSSVMWFACLEPLYDLIFSNLEDHEKYGLYTIDRVILKTTILEALPCPAGFRPIQLNSVPPIPLSPLQAVTTLGVETLSEYAFVDENLSVLRSSLHLQDYSFSVKSRGLQSTAIAAVAVVVGLLHVPSTWTAELLAAVVKYGDALHHDSARVFRTGARNLSPSELLTVFVVGDVRANIHVHCHTVAGLLHTYDLAEGLTLFFRNNCSGILHLPNLAVAVMQHYGKFYLVDPYPHDEHGRTSFDGTSCVMKCDTIGRMAEIFVSNCNYKRTTLYTLNAVNILSLHFFSQAKSQCAPTCSK